MINVKQRVEAIQFDGDNVEALKDFVPLKFRFNKVWLHELAIENSDCVMLVRRWDWVVKLAEDNFESISF